MGLKRLLQGFGRLGNRDRLEVGLRKANSYDFLAMKGKLTKYSNKIGGLSVEQHVAEITRPQYPLVIDFSEVREADCRASAFLVGLLKSRVKTGFHLPIAVYGLNGQMGYHFDAAQLGQLSIYDIFVTDSLEKAVEICGIPAD